MSALTLLLRAAWRFHLRRPVEFALCILGLALGVALVVAMDLAIDSARRSFSVSSSAVFGRTTHTVEAGVDGISERLYLELVRLYPELHAAPVVQGEVRSDAGPLTLVGLDPFSDGPFRDHVPGPVGAGGADLVGLLTRPGTILATSETLDILGVKVGQSLPVEVAGRTQQLEVLGTVVASQRLMRIGLERVLLADISTAQEVLDRRGRLSRIDLIVEPGEELPAGLAEALPPPVRLQGAAARSRSVIQMTSAFYLSLRMLSLLALVVGLFIVYNTMTFAVVRRRALIGTLRAVGVSTRGVLASVLAEGVCLCALGALVGIPLGVWLADELLLLVARTVDDLYFSNRVTRLFVTPGVLLRGALCALGGGLVAALMPALEATRVPARAAMLPVALEQRLVARAPWLGLAGVFLALCASVLVLGSEQSLLLAYGALFALVLAGAALAPVTVLGLVRCLDRLLARRTSMLVLMGIRGLGRGLSRSAVAVAALAVALSTTLGMAIMVDSFRGSLGSWLETTLEADLYVGIPGRAPQMRLDDALVRSLRALPGVQAVSVSTDREVTLDDGPLWLKAVDVGDARYRALKILAGSTDPWRDLGAGQVLVSEPLLRRTGKVSGDLLRLPTDRGPRSYRIAGVFRDYGSDRGMLLMSQHSLREAFHEDGYTGIGVHLEPGAEMAAVQERARALVATLPEVGVRSTAWIRDASMQVFDRTFLITRVMQWLATLVACVGVVSALMALSLERRREFAILRAQGTTRAQLLASLQVHNGLLGLAAGLLSLPLGVAMARVLVDVVNRRAFGWSMEFQMAPGILFGTLALAVLSALLAGLYPAWSMSSTPPARALSRG